MAEHSGLTRESFARFAYRWRFVLSALFLAGVGAIFAGGAGRIAALGAAVEALGDTSDGSGDTPPLVFDPRMGNWFGEADAAVNAYNEIERRFVAEDYVMVTFEEPDHELGVFSPRALAATARLTAELQKVPGVRHVRSLTSNPWIRWGAIEDGAETEEGLIISDLVEGDPTALAERDVVERMIAVLGAERVAERLGGDRVRAVIGESVSFDDLIGEPRLLGTIVDTTGTTAAIQVQVLRPSPPDDAVDELFENGGELAAVAPSLYSIQYQRASVRGIEHVVRTEQGLAIPTPERAELSAWIAAMPEGEARDAKRLELADPTRNFMENADGKLVRKFFEYEPLPGGGYADSTGAMNVIEAPPDFQPEPRSPYDFYLGGVPFFERNFEEVGLADAKYIPLMFLVIIVCLAFVFRSVIGVAASLVVVFASIAAMVGTAFLFGDLFNNLTMISPNMLTAVAIADAIHLVSAWAIFRTRFDDKRELITEVLRHNALPVFLTSVTTSVGFYSLSVSTLVPVKQLGYMAGLGTIFAYLLSMSVVPALLSLVPHKKRAVRGRSWMANVFPPHRAAALVGFVQKNRRLILGGAAAATVVGIIGLARVEIDTDFRAMFPDDNPVMSDFHWIESRMGGVGDLEIVFTSPVPTGSAPGLSHAEEERLAELSIRRVAAADDEFLAPLSTDESAELDALEAKERAWNATRIGVSTSFLGALDDFEARLREEMTKPGSPLRVVTDLSSPLDVLRKMHQVQNENRAAYYRVPGEKDVPPELRTASVQLDEWTEEYSYVPPQSGSSLVAQYYLQYENGAKPGENLATQLSVDRSRFRMQGRVEQAPSAVHTAAFRRIEEIAREEFPVLDTEVLVDGQSAASVTPGAADLTVSGKTLLYARTTRVFAVGFVQSMSIALIAITTLIALIFRSVRIALVSLIPNVLPIIIPLSAFGLVGASLDGPAILVSSVALGVCVDDTIHFLTKFVRARKAGKSTEASLQYVFEEAGSALTITTVVLVIGFGTLLLSDFSPNVMMGQLASAMIALAWVMDFLVTPAVIGFVEPATSAVQEPDQVPTPAAAAS